MLAPLLGRLVYYLDRGHVGDFSRDRLGSWRVVVTYFSTSMPGARLKGGNVGNPKAHANIISIPGTEFSCS